MIDDLASRLIAHNSCGCGCSSDTRRLIGEAADEIERLAADRRRFLRGWEESDKEIDRLRALITEWVEADDGVTVAADARPFVRDPYDVAIERCDRAYDALREEAGR